MMIKSRSLAEQQRERVAGDYSVTVDRSGMYISHYWYCPIDLIRVTNLSPRRRHLTFEYLNLREYTTT